VIVLTAVLTIAFNVHVAPKRPNPVTTTSRFLLNSKSGGKMTSKIHPAARGTGRES